MAPPIVTSKLEVEFVPGSGTWVDISDRINDLTILRPRAAPGEDQVPGTLTASLKNYPYLSGLGAGYCPFVPNNPAGRYYPNVTRDRRVRVTAMSGASTWVRFLGFIDKWLPSTGTGIADAVCTLTATDVLGRYARKRLLSYLGEVVLADANADYWPFDDGGDSASVRARSSNPATYPPRPGLVVVPSKPPGTLTFQGADGGHLTDGQAEFTRGDANTPAPVILLTVRPGQILGGFQASFKLSVDPSGSTGDTICAGYDRNADLLWRWSARISAGKVIWELCDNTGTARSFWDTSSPRDDAWHWWQIKFNSSTLSSINLRDKGKAVRVLGSTAWPYDPRNTVWVVLGGLMEPDRLGKQTDTLQGGISSFTLHHTSTVFDFSEFAVPGVTTDADRVSGFLSQQGADLTALTGGSTTSTPDAQQLMYTNATSDLLARWNEHARTTGGQLSVRPDGRRRWLTSELVRLPTVALTLDVADDLHMPAGEYQETQEEKPTRVTASGPVGTVTLIDSAAETLLAMSLEGAPIATSAGTLGLAQSAAALVMGGKTARLSQFAVDLSVAGTDKTAAMMALLVGDRIRVGGLAPELTGLTYQDVYASGWAETYIGETRQAIFVFDTDPADDPAEGILDDAEFSRTAFGDGVATVTGGTCVGITGTGTLIVTSSSPASTTAGDYPCDLDWNGERVTVNAPGGATSPQTFTVTARGVAPTVARVHVAGEIVDAWHAANAGF